MKKVILTLIIFIGTTTLSIESTNSTQSLIEAVEINETVEVKIIKTEWDILIESIAWIESRWNDTITGPTGDLGYLQITPIYVAEANRILGFEKFGLDDRTCRNKSIEMFQIVQKHHNPNKDIKRAIKLHNPLAPETYTEMILYYFNKFKQENV
jgi:hypothetical protein